MDSRSHVSPGLQYRRIRARRRRRHGRWLECRLECRLVEQHGHVRRLDPLERLERFGCRKEATPTLIGKRSLCGFGRQPTKRRLETLIDMENSMKITDIMTTEVETLPPDCTLKDVALRMREL